MKRRSWLAIIWLVTIVPLFVFCTQNVTETQLIDETETTTTVTASTTEPKADTETTVTVTTPTHELLPASFSYSNLTITPEEVMVDSPVTIEVRVTNTGELFGSGDVTLKIDEAEEATEKVTLEGGASQIVTFSITQSLAKTYSIDINGQSGTFVVNPYTLPDMDAFMKGIQFNDFGWGLDKPRPPEYGPLYNPPLADVSLRDLATTGANWISVVVFVFQETISSTNITSNQYKTASDEALQYVTDLAHSHGIRVVLFPSLFLSNDPEHSWIDIGSAFTSETQWQEWFASYRENINHYASFAQEAGVDMLYIGSELPGVTHREEDWRRIIKEVRERFDGPISYDSVFWGFPIAEFKRIAWWDAVDYIATDFWYPLTDKNDPTIAEMKEGFIKTGYLTDLENISKQFNKSVIVSEIGYDNFDGANSCPPPCDIRTGAPVDLQEQADCYQATLEVLWGKPWLQGIFWFQWSGIGMPWSGSPQDKPAEEVLRKFYLTDE
jgi:hypothetical protein